MSAWIETLGVILISILGTGFGVFFSGLRRPCWVWGYIIPVFLVSILLVTKFMTSLAFLPLFYLISAGRLKFVILSFAVTMGLTTPLSRLSHRYERIAVCVMMLGIVFWFCIMPFLVPAFIKDDLLALDTNFDSEGVAYQSTSYTCAPAAAATALRQLGFPADEGELAILAHTSPVAGTLPYTLEQALRERYGKEGLRSRYRHFRSVSQLEDSGLILAVIKDTLLTDHCVAVLDVSDNIVTIADPVIGKRRISRKRFEKIWRHTGIVLKREIAAKKS